MWRQQRYLSAAAGGARPSTRQPSVRDEYCHDGFIGTNYWWLLVRRQQRYRSPAGADAGLGTSLRIRAFHRVGGFSGANGRLRVFFWSINIATENEETDSRKERRSLRPTSAPSLNKGNTAYATSAVTSATTTTTLEYRTMNEGFRSEGATIDFFLTVLFWIRNFRVK